MSSAFPDFRWSAEGTFSQDIEFGFLNRERPSPKRFNPQVVLNGGGATVLKTLREELARCSNFSFSVAFVSADAVAMMKEAFNQFEGRGTIITSDYLGFNSPQALEELRSLERLGIEVRRNTSGEGFHPKGYIFQHPGDVVTAMVGSSNFTPGAITRQQEWNLKVTALRGSDLSDQLSSLLEQQRVESVALTREWIDEYAKTYVPPQRRPRTRVEEPVRFTPGAEPVIQPNDMQRDALDALAGVRSEGERKAIIISATGTGKTILSALDVRAYQPRRMIFVVHREQILDRTIEEYKKVLGGPDANFGKLSGNSRELDCQYVFATVQTLSRPDVLQTVDPQAFDYVLVDEAHRVGSASYQRVLNHLEPEFLLGMTATPERGDGINIYEQFDFNVPYEIRLHHALEAEMLAPFHYYGVADVVFDDGTTTDDSTDFRKLISPERVRHVIDAIEVYGQAGVAPRGLIFCGRKDEAHALSQALNQQTLRGKPLRTEALTGDHSIEYREEAVRRLERGELDYLLTVDIFNEGVDIPSVNQVVMLRQTQSAIIFVQQLGRGLRKAEGKEYLVVIDFIGNYTNNYLVPVALFGDDSLNKESLRKNLISSEEMGSIAGLSSVQFDKIAQQRVLDSIADTRLDSLKNLRKAIQEMQERTGTTPRLYDFLRFESVDPIILATHAEHYPALLYKALKRESTFSPEQNRALGHLSHEILPAKRLHEFMLLQSLLEGREITEQSFTEELAASGLLHQSGEASSAIASLTLETHSKGDIKKFGLGIVERHGNGTVELRPEFIEWYRNDREFRTEIDDILATGWELTERRYAPDRIFTPGRQYSRKDSARAIGWSRGSHSTIYGYRTDEARGVAPLFVTLHKADDVEEGIAYEDELLDRTSMTWMSRRDRTLESDEVNAIAENRVTLHVFMKKDDAEGTDFYYLGRAHCEEAHNSTMTAKGKKHNVVKTLLRFEEPIDAALYDYFHPTTVLD